MRDHSCETRFFPYRGNVVFLPVNSPLRSLSLNVFLGDAGCSASMYVHVSFAYKSALMLICLFTSLHTPVEKEGSSDERCGGSMHPICISTVPICISTVTLMCMVTSLLTHWYKKEAAAMTGAAEGCIESMSRLYLESG